MPEVDDPSVRELFIWSYRLLYRVLDHEVQISAFIHEARDLAAILKQD